MPLRLRSPGGWPGHRTADTRRERWPRPALYRVSMSQVDTPSGVGARLAATASAEAAAVLGFFGAPSKGRADLPRQGRSNRDGLAWRKHRSPRRTGACFGAATMWRHATSVASLSIIQSDGFRVENRQAFGPWRLTTGSSTRLVGRMGGASRSRSGGSDRSGVDRIGVALGRFLLAETPASAGGTAGLRAMPLRWPGISAFGSLSKEFPIGRSSPSGEGRRDLLRRASKTRHQRYRDLDSSGASLLAPVGWFAAPLRRGNRGTRRLGLRLGGANEVSGNGKRATPAVMRDGCRRGEFVEGCTASRGSTLRSGSGQG